MTEELIPLLGEIRDQLRRIADIFEKVTILGESNLNIETGILEVRVKGTVSTKETRDVQY